MIKYICMKLIFNFFSQSSNIYNYIKRNRAVIIYAFWRLYHCVRAFLKQFLNYKLHLKVLVGHTIYLYSGKFNPV